MNQKLKVFGAFFGMTAVIVGAYGAHALKDLISPDSLQSFETAVKYQMYHAMLMIVLGFNLQPNSKFIKLIFYMLTFGILLFSVSIYFLATNALTAFDFSTIALITPLGGSLLIISWLLVLIRFSSKIKKN